ncbi:MAG: Icc family phosphohydrolase phage protein [Limisphaerales bacterium]|nr:MAG: Icc family phosphohydrolase phage protein [Limisphaerales bacterium]TXT49075.1 MAG: Icc family phosphohydrolase phage protein [Limisphaerales bacterium]
MSQLYPTAKQFLQLHPTAGKGRLAAHLNIKTPSARRLIERYRGETQGHGTDPDYFRVRQLKQAQPQLGAHGVAARLALTVDKARLHLARYEGAQVFQSAAIAAMFPPATMLPPAAVAAAAPAVSTVPVPTAGPVSKTPELQDCVGDATRDLNYLGPKVRTMEELLVYAEVDRTVWEVERYTINKWDVGAKDPQSGSVLTTPLYQIKVWLRRRVVEQQLQNLITGMLDAFKVAAPPARVITRPPAGDGLLEISILDLHLGKHCWAEEVGEAYDLNIAQRTFHAALEDLLAKGAAMKPSTILLPIGNDFFNVDTIAGTTTAGTPQDEDGRWQQSFVAGRKLMVQAIERCREVAPVEIVMVAGNHDTARLYYLGEVLAGWFRHCPDVRVDASPTQRKYFRWHHSLIGFTHGNNEPVASLPIIMATEQRAAWAQTLHHEWHLGHFHARQKKVFQAVADQHGVIVRVLPSLCPADAWHKSRGYQGARAAEAFFFDPTAGCVAEFHHHPA